MGVAFAAVARVALDLRAAVPVEGENGVNADAGWGGGLFDGRIDGYAGPSGGIVCFSTSARPGVGSADGACVALGGGPGRWLGLVGGFLCGGEMGG